MPETQSVPVAESQQSKLKKIEWYTSQLISQAVSKEKEGRVGDALVDYLQAADLLLLLAKGQQDYPKWKAYSDKAISCQQRVKLLIATRKQQPPQESGA